MCSLTPLGGGGGRGNPTHKGDDGGPISVGGVGV